MRILCDMDGVVADINTHWLGLLNRYHGESLTREHIIDWELDKFCVNATPRDVYGFLKNPGFFLHLDPIPGAIQGVQTLLANGHEVVFVTSCRHGHADKRSWIQNHFQNFDLKNIIFAERKELVRGDVMIDDYPANLTAWWLENQDGIPICFAHPYNTDYRGIRLTDWDQILHYIKYLPAKPEAMAGGGAHAG